MPYAFHTRHNYFFPRHFYVWWEVIVPSNFLEFCGERASCFNVGTSNLSINFYAMNFLALFEPCNTSFDKQ